MGLRAVPACDPRPRWRHPPIGAVAGKPTAALRMAGTALQACLAPGSSANVVVAGEPRSIAKLHRPSARAAPTAAGLSFCGTHNQYAAIARRCPARRWPKPRQLRLSFVPPSSTCPTTSPVRNRAGDPAVVFYLTLEITNGSSMIIPSVWHVEEFFNLHQALGWKRAGR